MKIHGYDKETVELCFRYSSKIHFTEIPGYHFSNDAVIELSQTVRTFNNIMSSVPNEGILYFDKSCTFPRHKLTESNYTRCVKLEKATAIVVSKDIGKNVRRTQITYTVFEFEDKLYIHSEYDQQRLDHINRQYPNAKIIYKGLVCVYPPNSQLLLQNITKPLILDTDLDKKISSNLPTLTEEDCKQIINMIGSMDGTTVDLGVKLLSSFNVTATPFTVKTILCLNNAWTIRPVATNVATEAMLNSINLDVYKARESIRALINDKGVYSDYDKTLSVSVLKPCLAAFIKEKVKRDILTVQQQYGLKVNITVE